MQKEKLVILRGIEAILADGSIPWERLRGKTALVTGATGLIGRLSVKTLLAAGARVIALSRDSEKARSVFTGWEAKELSLLKGDVLFPPQVEEPIDYILHGASITDSESFVKRPVETLRTAFLGTDAMLSLAREKQVLSMAYLSSMEVYGFSAEEKPLAEGDVGPLDPLSPRASYPEGKRAAETLCRAYATEYGIPVKIVRLAQTFGPGIAENDTRALAEFIRRSKRGQDIVLRTDGESRRMALYTADAVTAILTVLLKGENGAAYNAANQSAYGSVREMAEQTAQALSGGKTRVRVEPARDHPYPPGHRLYLDTGALEALGWKARVGLADMLRRTAEGMDDA